MSERAEDELGVETSLAEVVSRVEELEWEVDRLKALIPIRSMRKQQILTE